MPNKDSKFNPAYSTITGIFLVDTSGKNVIDINSTVKVSTD
jgi:hypothetical protein